MIVTGTGQDTKAVATSLGCPVCCWSSAQSPAGPYRASRVCQGAGSTRSLGARRSCCPSPILECSAGSLQAIGIPAMLPVLFTRAELSQQYTREGGISRQLSAVLRWCAAADDLVTGGGASALQELISHHDGGRGAGRQVSRRAPDKCAPSPRRPPAAPACLSCESWPCVHEIATFTAYRMWCMSLRLRICKSRSEA